MSIGVAVNTNNGEDPQVDIYSVHSVIHYRI